MRKAFLFVAGTLVIVSSCYNLPAQAQSLVEPDYAGEPMPTTPWYEHINKANAKADQTFITGMRPHHAGALTMADEYLASSKKSSVRLQALAKGIKHNQTFEIGMLDTIEDHLHDIDFDKNGEGWYLVATQGLAKNQRFVRLSVPPLQFSFSDDHVSAEDVRFAKAMIIHHEGALIMAKDYIDDPNATNGYLQRMCLDILRDQAQEIALMHDIIADYPGNPDEIKIVPSMVHGMDGMMHHMDISSVNGNKDHKMQKKHKMPHMHHGS